MIIATSEYGIYSLHLVYIDTTNFHKDLVAENIKKRLYAFEGFNLLVNKEIYIKQTDSTGKPIRKQKVTLKDINPLYYEDFSIKFEKIKTKFGNFTIEYNPSLNGTGEEIYIGKKVLWNISFDSLVKVMDYLNFMENEIDLIPYIDFEPGFPNLIPNERSLQGWSDAADIQTSNSDAFYENNFHKRGFGWNIYSLKMPMAWEIWTGDSSIVVSVYDIFGDGQNDPHPDLPINQLLTDGGNWLVLDQTFGFYDGNPAILRNTYYPAIRLNSISPEHGITVLSMAISLKEKGHLPEIPTAEQVTQNGVELGEMQAKLLQKIEELTLYVIELKKENEQIKKKLEKKR